MHLLDPKQNLGKIVCSLEKYFDVRSNKIKVKARPVLIIGYEPNYSSVFQVDYELLPISRISNSIPDPTYDYPIEGQLVAEFGLTSKSYIRTHKTTWNHVRNITIDQPIYDMRTNRPQLYNEILRLNEQWVINRTASNLLRSTG